MASTPEGKVKDAVKKVLKRFAPVWYFMPVSGGYGKHGVPDFIVCANGRFFVIECKAEGRDLTELQRREIIKIMECGGVALTIHNSDQADMITTYLHMMGCHEINA